MEPFPRLEFRERLTGRCRRIGSANSRNRCATWASWALCAPGMQSAGSATGIPRILRREDGNMKAADHFRAMRGKSPEDAKFFWSGGPVEVAERTWFQSRFSGVTAFETDEGIVLVDSGMAPLAPALAALLREKTAAPIHTAI